MTEVIAPDQLWLGAFVGAQMLVVFFCVIEANAYRDRPLLLHAAATLMAVLAVQSLIGRPTLPPRAVFLLLPALAGLQLLDLVSHAGGLRIARRWLLAVSAIAVPVLAIFAAYSVWCFAIAILAWNAVVVVVLARVWRQSQPWIWCVPPAQLALLAAAAMLLLRPERFAIKDVLVLSSLLTVWSASIYLATGWRGRISGATRARVHARTTVDPLTGLATPLVLAQRVQASRHLLKRYGHPSVLMVVHIENLASLAEEFGPEAAESAVLAAASRVREALLRDGDVAARLTHARIGVLAEGAAPGEAAATVATRILVAGLKEPLAVAKAEYLRFRIVLTGVPVGEVTPKMLLHKLCVRMDQEVRGGSERRIVTVTQEELAA